MSTAMTDIDAECSNCYHARSQHTPECLVCADLADDELCNEFVGYPA